MKVIFLDHFGVMCLSTFDILRTKDSLPSIEELKGRKQFEDFNKECVNILNEIINKTNVEIIVSSDWKYNSNLENMQDFYISQGVVKKPIGCTPRFFNNKLTLKEIRENEILEYIKNNFLIFPPSFLAT